MTTPVKIPFGEWLPDLPAHLNPGALIANNVIPQLKSYRSLSSLSSFSNALTGVCLGAFWSRAANGDLFNFAGDATKLYNLVGSVTWTDISGSSAPYASGNWDFAKFGELVLAVSSGDPIQKYEMNVDSVFADLAGSPPQGKYIAAVRDFIMVGNIPALGPNFVQWSGFNDATEWTAGIRTQSDTQELFGNGGQVQRIVPGDHAVIYTEQSIWRADYVGPPVIFQFDEVERKRGTPAPNSVVWSGENNWYWGWDNFYHWNGRESTPISHNRVSRWFQQNAASDAWDSMRGAVDRVNRLVIWAFRSSSAQTINDRLIIYNWAADKWACAEVDTQIIDEYARRTGHAFVERYRHRLDPGRFGRVSGRRVERARFRQLESSRDFFRVSAAGDDRHQGNQRPDQPPVDLQRCPAAVRGHR